MVKVYIYVYRYKHTHIGIQIIIRYDFNVLPLFSNNVVYITHYHAFKYLCLSYSSASIFHSFILIHLTHIFCLLGPCILWCSNIYGLILPCISTDYSQPECRVVSNQLVLRSPAHSKLLQDFRFHLR